MRARTVFAGVLKTALDARKCHLPLHRRLPWMVFKAAFDHAISSLDTGQI